MDSSGPHRVRGESGSRPNSPVGVDGGQASHAPPMNDQGHALIWVIPVGGEPLAP